MISEQTVPQIDEKRLGLAQFGRMDTEHEISMIGQSAQEIEIDGNFLAMLLDHALQDGQLRDAHHLILLPPVRIKTKRGKGAVDARLTEQLVAIGCLNGRARSPDTTQHQHGKTHEN